MLQNLPQNQTALIPSESSIAGVVDNINSHIDSCYCEHLTVDISFLNVIDACYVSTLCAARHYIKYPQGDIKWRVPSGIVEDFIKDMNLGNSTFYL